MGMSSKKECPSCAMEVDKTADECPYCHYEFGMSNSNRNGIVLIAIVLLLIFLATMLL